MDYITHEYEHYNVHTIKTDKFKNVILEVIFRNNIQKETIMDKVFLMNMLIETSKKYSTKRKLVLALEDLYQANVIVTYKRIGTAFQTKVVVDFLNPKFTKEDYFEEAIQFPFELVLNPNITDNVFDTKTFNTIKNRLMEKIETENESSDRFAIKKALQFMDPDSMSSLNLTGTKEELDKVTNESLLKVYDELINNSYIDINVIGDIDEDHINELIKKYAKFNNKPNYELNYYITNKEKETPSVGSIDSSFRQTKLVYLYNTNNLTEYEKEYVLPIYNLILGGPTLETRLYKAVRDDQSLCYSIFSLTYAHDNLLRITTGIDLTKIDLTRSIIEKAVKDMNKVLPKEVEYAVSLYETMINMNLDSPSGLLDLYFTQYIFNKPDLNTRINTLKKITPQEIENLSNKIKLNTVFVLKGDKHE